MALRRAVAAAATAVRRVGRSEGFIGQIACRRCARTASSRWEGPVSAGILTREQSFRLADILAAHRQALDEGLTDAIDSCSLMLRYGRQVWAVRGTHDNIQITTPEDFYVFRALSDLSESTQILGLQ